MNPRTTLLTTLLATAACRKPSTPATPARDAAVTRAAADVPRDVAAPDRPHVVRPLSVPPGAVRPDAGAVRRTAAAHVATTDEDAWALASAPGGAWWVRAVNHRGQRVSEIVATAIGHDGVATGAPRLLRRTTGPLRSVSVEAVGEHVWVAWHTVRGDEDPAATRDEHIVAALHGNADLSEVGAPVTIANFSRPHEDESPYAWPFAMVRVFVRDDGGALTVSTGARAVCTHSDGDEGPAERVPCEGWNIARVEVSGAKRVSVETALCPVDVPRAFVRVPGGVAYMVQDDHIGTKLMLFTEPLGSARTVTPPIDDALWHYGEPAMAWSDGVMALTAHYLEHSENDPTAEFGVMARGSVSTPTLHDSYGGDTLPGLRAEPLRCVDGHPVASVRWQGGPAAGVRFDPTRPGTSIDLASWIDFRALPLPPHAEEPPSTLVWAGAALVGVTDGALLRWTCAANGALRLAPSP